MNIKILHHNDLDGRCSAFLIYKLYKNIGNVICIEMDYNKEIDYSLINKDDYVYILDFHISLKDMDILQKITSNVIWIDHHQSAIDKYREYEKEVKGFRSIEKSGCYLTWEQTHSQLERQIPTYIEYINDYDLWKFENVNTMNFIYGISMYDTHPKSSLWEKLDDNKFLDEIINNGVTIQKARKQIAKDYMDKYGFKVDIYGLKGICLNKKCSLLEFESVKDKYDIFVTTFFDGKKWITNLYSEKYEVLSIAQRNGGGGHLKACGFISDNIPSFISKRK